MERTAKHFRKRDAILSCLRQTTEHPSADWVYAKLKPEIPDLALGTVYRNLTLFKDQGLIASLGTVGGVERFDGNVTPHVHFICTACHRVMDLSQIQVPEELNASASRASGGQVESCQLTFRGRCAGCKEI
jgi:Fur family peroxide stress response transcriptional regulator